MTIKELRDYLNSLSEDALDGDITLEINNVPLDRIAISRIESGNRFVADYEVVELAKALGVSKGIISLWENGLREPSMTNLIALAKFFEVSIDYLVGLENI